jgi:hypothetical protein
LLPHRASLSSLARDPAEHMVSPTGATVMIGQGRREADCQRASLAK